MTEEERVSAFELAWGSRAGHLILKYLDEREALLFRRVSKFFAKVGLKFILSELYAYDRRGREDVDPSYIDKIRKLRVQIYGFPPNTIAFASLTHLVCTRDSRSPIYVSPEYFSKFPETLIRLDLGGIRVDDLVLPSRLEQLYMDKCVFTMSVFPQAVKIIYLQNCIYTLKNIPDTLTELSLIWSVGALDRLPSSLLTYNDTNMHGYASFEELPRTLVSFGSGRFYDSELNRNGFSKCVWTDTSERKTFRRPSASLPPNLKSISFDDEHNDEVDHLPSSLKYLRFGMLFNQSVSHLPSSITHLVFGDSFNKGVDRLPSGLVKLTFGRYFNQPVNRLPEGLVDLTLGHYFNKNVAKLPESLRTLTLGINFNKSVDHLPKNLLVLNIEGLFNRSVDKLPPSLNSLKLGGIFNKGVDNLPASLKSLWFGWNFNRPVDNLPSSIEALYFGENFNQPVGALPPKLKYLHFGDRFNQPVDRLPSTLELIYFRKDFNQPVDRLPDSLKTLYFVGCRQHRWFSVDTPWYPTPNHEKYCVIDLNDLPDGLEVLNLSVTYKGVINRLPSSLRKIFTSDITQIPGRWIQCDDASYVRVVDEAPSSIKQQ